jgi:outer membrane protein
MKTQLLSIFFVLLSSLSFGQKFFFVDTDYILENSEEYQAAMDEINASSTRWQETIEAKYKEIEEMTLDFQAEKILLTEDLRLKKQGEIEKKKAEAREYQKKKFGVGGELFKKREEAIKPIQDKIFGEIEKLAKSGNYAVVFDRSASGNILYADNKYDKTEDVMRRLGITKSSEKE